MKSLIKWLASALLIGLFLFEAGRVGGLNPLGGFAETVHETKYEYNVYRFNLPQATKKEPLYYHHQQKFYAWVPPLADEFVGRGPLMPHPGAIF